MERRQCLCALWIISLLPENSFVANFLDFKLQTIEEKSHETENKNLQL